MAYLNPNEGPSRVEGNAPEWVTARNQQEISSTISKALSPSGNGSCYLDMGELAGGAGAGTGFRSCYYAGAPGGGNYYQESGLQSITTTLINQLQSAGINSVSLSFAQISDIANLAAGQWQGTSNVDSILDMFQNASGFNSPPPVLNANNQVVAPNALNYFCSLLNQAGIKVDLSLGGQRADASCWNMGSNPVQTATLLTNFMKENGISSVDFDIEDPQDVVAANSTGQSGVASFFQTVNQNLQGTGGTSSITLDANVPTNPNCNNSSLDFLFQSPTGASVFPQYFSSVNIMNYGGPNNAEGGSTDAYLDANNPVDGLQQWLQAVGNDPSRLHMGFSAGTDYTQASTYTGGGIPGATNWLQEFPQISSMSPGQAAAFVYQQVLAQVQKNTGIDMSSMGAPYWWAGDTAQILQPPGTPLSADKMMSDFYQTISAGGVPVNSKSQPSQRMFGM